LPWVGELLSAVAAHAVALDVGVLLRRRAATVEHPTPALLSGERNTGPSATSIGATPTSPTQGEIMNTQIRTQPQNADSDSPKKRSPRRALRRALTAFLLSFGLIAGLSAMAAPAQAATAVSFCFKFANPPSFSTYANRPVFLYYKAPHGWEYLGRSGQTNSNGCGTFYSTPTNVQLAVRAYSNTQYQTWDGWSQYLANTGSGTANLGSGLVYRTR
jgi:hypothetical protein